MDLFNAHPFSARPPAVLLGGYQAPVFPIRMRKTHPEHQDAFPQLALVRSVTPVNAAETGEKHAPSEVLPALTFAVIPGNYGRIIRILDHKRELEELIIGWTVSSPDRKRTATPGRSTNRAHSVSRREGKIRPPVMTIANLQSAADTYGDTPTSRSFQYHIPAYYMTRKQTNIPGVVRVKGEQGQVREVVPSSPSSSTRLHISTPAIKKDIGSSDVLHSVPSTPGRRGKSASPTRKREIHSPKKGESGRKSTENTISGSEIKSYEGDYHTSKRQGWGVAKYHNGDEYIGYWFENQRQGKGTFSRKSTGLKYVGDWYSDLRNGYGVVTFQNGDVLEAKWVEGKLGPEPVTLRIGDLVYTGEFSVFQPHGNGQIAYKDGVIYKGSWVNGIRQGFGLLLFPSGSFFEGMFESDYTQGPGLLLIRKGLLIKADFKSSPSAPRKPGRRRKNQLKNEGSSPSVTSVPSKSAAFGDLSRFPYFQYEVEVFESDVVWKTLLVTELNFLNSTGSVHNGTFAAGKLNG